MNIDFKKALPHLITILCFYLFTVAYFTPLFQGKARRAIVD
jgi:hypothetical protein